MAGGSLAKVNVEGSSPFARSHFEGNPERVPKPSRALAPSGEAILRQRERAMALANLGWGYMKIRDALRTGLKIDDRTNDGGQHPAGRRDRAGNAVANFAWDSPSLSLVATTSTSRARTLWVWPRAFSPLVKAIASSSPSAIA
jgi:hypothetical protein